MKLFAASVRREEIDDAALVTAVSRSLANVEEAKARGLVDVYRRSRRGLGLPDSNLDMLDAIGTDARFRVPAMRLALAQRQHQANTYVYLFKATSRRRATGHLAPATPWRCRSSSARSMLPRRTGSPGPDRKSSGFRRT